MKKLISLTLLTGILVTISTYKYIHKKSAFSSHSTQSKKAIIIGASSGIGAATAQELARRGYTVGLTARRYNCLQKIKDTITTPCFIEYMDVSHPEAAQKILLQLIDKMGGADVILISAGTDNCLTSWEKQKEIIDVNIVGFTALATTAIEHFLRQKSGHLAGISSVAGIRPFANDTVYSASKMYISFYLNGVREKYKRLGESFTVTDIQPGLVDTKMGLCSDFWKATPAQAARQICDALEAKQEHAYITKRWCLIAWIMKIVPDYLFYKIL